MEKMRDTKYAKELARATFDLTPESQGRIERLFFKREQKEGYRFSWWKNNRMIPRPLDFTEEEFLMLLELAIREGVFSDSFLGKFKELIENIR